MRILMLSPDPRVRGPIPKHAPLLVDALNALGCEVVTEPWGRHHDHESVPGKLIGRTLDIRRVRKALLARRFDVMVLRTSHEARSLLGAVPLLSATRRLVPKVVVQFSGGRSDWLVAPGHRTFKAASAALFQLCDAVLVLSSEEARDYGQFWPQGHFRVVANPFLPADEHGRVVCPKGDSPLTLLFVGRLVREKGIFEMLTAFAMVNQRQACRLVIVGDGRDGAKLTKHAAALGLNGTVTMTGYLVGEQLLDAYRYADVFVLPSYREGFPRAISEALAAGLPVVTSKTGGIVDHLEEETNALFVEPGDAQGLARALARILSDPDLRTRMSAANRAKIANFDPDVVANDYLVALGKIDGR